jgi:hypothetical protein
MYLDEIVPPPLNHPCHAEIVEAQRECGNTKIKKIPGRKGKVRDCSGTECEKAMACILVPKKEDKRLCCHPSNTGHHLIQDNWIKNNDNFPNYKSLRNGARAPTPAQRAKGAVTDNDAPTVCTNRFRSPGTLHRNIHNVQAAHVELHMPGMAMASEPWDYAAAKRSVADSYKDVPELRAGGCKQSCIDSQLDAFYGDDGSRKLNAPSKDDLGEDRAAMLKKYTPSKPKNPRKR